MNYINDLIDLAILEDIGDGLGLVEELMVRVESFGDVFSFVFGETSLFSDWSIISSCFSSEIESSVFAFLAEDILK